MSTVLQGIKKLEKLKGLLASPAGFYASVLPQWRELAKGVASEVLAASQPPEMEPALWQRQRELLLGRIVAEMVGGAGEEVGIVISCGSQPAGVDERDPQGFSIAGFSVQEIERWVEAGRNKSSRDEPGKNLDSLKDAADSNLQIAWRVIYAIKRQRPGHEGLVRAIAEFLGAVATDEQAEGVYRDILRAWLEVFVVRAREDFGDWVASRVKMGMR